MIGRYVAGTLLILGVAMVMAPEAPETEAPDVARADTSTMSLAVTQSQAQPSETAALPTPAATTPAASATPKPAVVISQAPALSKPEPVLVAAAQPSVVSDADDRVSVSFETQNDVQIGGIATLAGLEPAPTSQSAAPLPVRPEYLYVTGSSVNVRSGPSTDYRVVGRVVRGDSVELVSQEIDGWAEIRVLGTEDTGFMAARFLAEDLNG